jgi:DNA-binding LacI/PurR family transcriptional regulator
MKLITAPPKSQQIADFIRKEIRCRRLLPGQRLESIRTLAEKFGVGRQVVLSAFAILVNEQLLIAEVGRGTFVNPVLPRVKSIRRIGLLIQQYNLDSVFNRNVLAGVNDTAEELEIELVWTLTNKSQRIAEWCNLHRLEGLLITGSVDGQLIAEAENAGLPFIVVGNYDIGPEINSVETDFSGSMATLINAVVQKYHCETFGAILSSSSLTSNWQLVAGIKSGLNLIGKPFIEDFIVHSESENGYEGFAFLMEQYSSYPDFVFVTEQAYPGVAKYIFEHHLADTARPGIVTSISDTNTILYPELITVALSGTGRQFGSAAVRELIKIIKGEAVPPVKLIFSPDLSFIRK